MNVIPVKMGEKDLQVQFLTLKLLYQGISQVADSRAPIQNQHLVIRQAHLDTRCIPTVVEILNHGSRSRTSHPPKL